MRTTVTLEPDVVSQIKELAHRRRASFKATLNDVMRRGPAQQGAGSTSPPRFVVEPHANGFRPGIDVNKLNQLVDALEVDDFEAEARAGK